MSIEIDLNSWREKNLQPSWGPEPGGGVPGAQGRPLPGGGRRRHGVRPARGSRRRAPLRGRRRRLPPLGLQHLPQDAEVAGLGAERGRGALPQPLPGAPLGEEAAGGRAGELRRQGRPPALLLGGGARLRRLGLRGLPGDLRGHLGRAGRVGGPGAHVPGGARRGQAGLALPEARGQAGAPGLAGLLRPEAPRYLTHSN